MSQNGNHRLVRRMATVATGIMILCSLAPLQANPAEAVVGAPCSGSRLRTHDLYDDRGSYHVGRVELWYRNGQNCVQTFTAVPGRSGTWINAVLEVGTTNNPATAKVATRDIDAGHYLRYAGGVWLQAANRCVKYSGGVVIPITSDGSETRYGAYTSPWTACG
jgi:hypothetical protein